MAFGKGRPKFQADRHLKNSLTEIVRYVRRVAYTKRKKMGEIIQEESFVLENKGVAAFRDECWLLAWTLGIALRVAQLGNSREANPFQFLRFQALLLLRG